MKTAQHLSMTLKGRQKEYFFLRHYTLNTSTGVISIQRVGREKIDLTLNLFEEGQRVIDVDCNLTKNLVLNYKEFFRVVP